MNLPGVNKSAPLAYQRVKDTLVTMLTSGRLRVGDKLPSERQLAKELGCNYHTVRRGLGLLEQEHWIERRVGSGTFVLRTGHDGSQRVQAVSGSKTMVGVLSQVRFDTFGTELLECLHHLAEDRGLTMTIRTTTDMGQPAIEACRQMVEQGCFAILLRGLPVPMPTADLQRLVQAVPVPVIFPMPVAGLEPFCYERADRFGTVDLKTIEMVCRYFQLLGYGRIASLGPDRQNDESLQHRATAYSRYVSRCELPNLARFVSDRAEDVDRIVRQWSDFAGDLAVICFDDDHALRLMTSLHKFNLRIPKDVAVLGFNNIPQSQTSDPPLSTIQFDYDYVAGAMLDHARALAAGGSAQGQGTARSKLVVRGSCGGRIRTAAAIEDILRQAEDEVLTDEERRA